MRPAYENPEALKARICERHERGMTLARIAEIPDLPSAATICRWRRSDPRFAQQLTEARRWGRALVKESRGEFTFDRRMADDVLRRVRMGEGVCQLVRGPSPPSRRRLDAWKRLNPDFAAELEAAKRDARRLRRRPEYFPYDEAVVDRIILAVLSGVRMGQLRRADPTLPGQPTIKRWRRQHPEFDGALAMAMRGGHLRQVRAAARDGCTPQTVEAVTRAIRSGATLQEASRQPGLPRYGTLCAWIRKHRDFAWEVQRAYQERSAEIAAQAREIALDCSPENVCESATALAALRRRDGGARPPPGYRRWGPPP